MGPSSANPFRDVDEDLAAIRQADRIAKALQSAEVVDRYLVVLIGVVE